MKKSSKTRVSEVTEGGRRLRRRREWGIPANESTECTWAVLSFAGIPPLTLARRSLASTLGHASWSFRSFMVESSESMSARGRLVSALPGEKGPRALPPQPSVAGRAQDVPESIRTKTTGAASVLLAAPEGKRLVGPGWG